MIDFLYFMSNINAKSFNDDETIAQNTNLNRQSSIGSNCAKTVTDVMYQTSFRLPYYSPIPNSAHSCFHTPFSRNDNVISTVSASASNSVTSQMQTSHKNHLGRQWRSTRLLVNYRSNNP